MKIWWPWRRTKQLLSLFDPPYGYNASVPLPRLEEQSGAPYAKNSYGPFYVINKECMVCGVPHVVAPDLIAWDDDSEGGHRHCYFKKQPETVGEVDRAIQAIAASCCGALAYAGSDAHIITKLRQLGARDAIVRAK